MQRLPPFRARLNDATLLELKTLTPTSASFTSQALLTTSRELETSMPSTLLLSVQSAILTFLHSETNMPTVLRDAWLPPVHGIVLNPIAVEAHNVQTALFEKFPTIAEPPESSNKTFTMLRFTPLFTTVHPGGAHKAITLQPLS